jgi:hypothetical protein
MTWVLPSGMRTVVEPAVAGVLLWQPASTETESVVQSAMERT